MGPVLFNIYVNDLISLLQNFCQLYNYADDNTLSFCHDDIDVVQFNLERACVLAIDWYKKNYMKVNAEKFQFMILGRKHENLRLTVNGIIMSPTKNIKLLGVTIDNDLNFTNHIRNISIQAAKQINVLSRLSRVLTLPCKIKILDTFFF